MGAGRRPGGRASAATAAAALLLAAACLRPAAAQQPGELGQSGEMLVGSPAAAPSPSAAVQPGLAAAQAVNAPAAPGKWKTLWRDEFKGKGVDPKKWQFDIGTGCQYLSGSESYPMCGWGNGEQQYYSFNNAYVQGGKLVVEARREADGYTLTSARLSTAGRFSVAPGDKYATIRVEAKILLPVGQGLWPALWLLPTYDERLLGYGKYGMWASSGEIDILEAKNDMAEISCSLQYGGPWPANRVTEVKVPPADPTKPWGGHWHVYALEWERRQIRWYIDGKLVSTQNSAGGNPAGGGWYSTGEGAGPDAPFDQPFHLMLNLAIGGGFTGNVAREVLMQTLATPKRMLVEYVRVRGR